MILCLRRVFTNSPKRGGRYYTKEFQSFPSGIRKHYKLDGQNTIELDFKGLHPTMLYHMENIPVPNDIYSMNNPAPKYRGLFKKALFIIINADNLKSATRALTQEICYLQKFKLPAGMSIKKLIEKTKEAHAPISKYFHNDWGAKLQYIDSQITTEILEHFLINSNIPILPIHDSYIVPEQHEEELREIMLKAYQTHIGSSIAIEKK